MKRLSIILILFSLAIITYGYFIFHQDFEIQVSFEYPINTSSMACSGGDIFLIEDHKKTRIFESRPSEKDQFAYCTPEISNITSQSAEIILCYASGGGSGECQGALFEYDIQNHIWTFISNGFYGEQGYIAGGENNGDDVEELIQYMRQKNYSVSLSLN